MDVLQFIFFTICMTVAVSSARIGNSKMETPQIMRGLEEINEPPCNDYTVGKSIFHDNPGKLWICVAVKNPLELACPNGQGFNGEQCVPWNVYPCTADKPPTCVEGPELTRPHQHQDPRMFYVCQRGEAAEYQCPEGSGFMNSKGDTGCVPWSRWRCVV